MKVGRQRSFDTDIALDKAMEIFWANGYPGTSMADLTNAMGINKPSLYSAFGNKEQLFKMTLDRYVNKHGLSHVEFLFEPDKNLRDRLRNYLTSIAKMLTNPELPGGCFVCFSTCEMGGNFLPPVALDAIVSVNDKNQSSFITFFENEKTNGNISTTRSVELLANYLLALQFGIAVLAKNGASYQSLLDIISYSITEL